MFLLAEEIPSDNEGYVYLKPEDVADAAASQKEYTHKKPLISVKEEYEDVKFVPHLPIDLNLLQKESSLEKIIPLDIQTVKPIEIQLKEENEEAQYETKTTTGLVPQQYQKKNSPKDTGMEPSHELSQEELNRYLAEYYASNENDISQQPTIETGFKPIKAQTRNPITQPMIPNTFKSNKKTQTTPGLRHFTSKNNHNNNSNNYGKQFNARIPKTHYSYPHYYWPRQNNGYAADRQKAELTRLYRSASNSGYTRYAKRVSYEEV